MALLYIRMSEDSTTPRSVRRRSIIGRCINRYYDRNEAVDSKVNEQQVIKDY